MRKIILLCSFAVLLACTKQSVDQPNYRLWYNQPAKVWDEALPLGNGRLGAMVFGNPEHERIQLNEESIWAGSKINNNNPNALPNLKKIQQKLFNSEYSEALKIAGENFVGTPPRIRSYQPLGDLLIDYAWESTPTDYRRELDLETGITSTEFNVVDKKFIQQAWISAPDNMLVVHVESPNNGLIRASVALKREKDAVIQQVSPGILKLVGQIVDNDDPLRGPGGEHMKFAAEMRVNSESGSVIALDTCLQVTDAKSITIIITAATDYNIEKLDYDRNINPEKTCSDILEKAADFSVDKLKQRHLEEYQNIFNRMEINFGADSLDKIPTDERLNRVKDGATDNGLLALYFQYGRYLLMGSSRHPGVLPANLQGIWNKDFNAAWNSDFHTNINLQMNYWLVENCNLTEMSEPLSNFMLKLMEPGAVTAREMYGTSGWTLHHLTDPFGRTGVADGVWGITPMNGPWMTFPVYEHFMFSNDTTFLRETAYPLLKGSAEFLLGFLTESPEGYLVTNPSHSPENTFFDTEANTKSMLTYASTIDVEIANALFDYCVEAAGILGVDKEFVLRLKEVQKRFPPVRINSNGCIQEWIRDFDEPEPGHRHMSHLLGLYPLAQFTPETPELFAAAQASIERRLSQGGGHTGWSRAWIINFFARLQNGEKAYENAMKLLSKSTLPNLFDTHPPFQIDGNFGGAAGIAEMLLQSHQKDQKGNFLLNILPALPSAISSGYVEGICARGGFELDIRWEAGQLKGLLLRSKSGKSCSVRYNGKTVELQTVSGKEYSLTDQFKL